MSDDDWIVEFLFCWYTPLWLLVPLLVLDYTDVLNLGVV